VLVDRGDCGLDQFGAAALPVVVPTGVAAVRVLDETRHVFHSSG
jgi:hypothetical protein